MARPSTISTVPAPPVYPHRWRILGLLGVAQLMLILDVTVVAVALPDISADLGLGRQPLTWVVSGYTLAFGGLLLLGGRAADLFGPAAWWSPAWGCSPPPPWWPGWPDRRGPAGRPGPPGPVGGLPVAECAVVGGEDLRRCRAGPGAGRLVGPGWRWRRAGAAVGRAAHGRPGWPWGFFVNVPVGLLLALSLHRALPRDAVGESPGRLDLLGAALVTAATGTLISALIQAGDRGWTSAATAVLAAAATALYSAFVVRVRHAAHPLINLDLLGRRPVVVGTVLVLVATALMITVFFLGSFYLQRSQGYDALQTGLLFLPVALATMAGAATAGRVLARLGPRAPGVAGLLVGGAGRGWRPPSPARP